MTIRLFQKKNCKGDSMRVTRNQRSLKDTAVGNHPSSLTMDAGDACLLFKREDWKGGVLYLRGRHEIENLGSPKQGGKTLFGNSITSIRITPFKMKLNVTIVLDDNGNANGVMAGSASDRERMVEDLIARANAFYEEEKALLELQLDKVTGRRDGKRFDLSNWESGRLPSAWKEKGKLDMIFVNSFDSGNVGLAKFPHWGKVAICATRNSGSNRDFDAVARTFVHEIGHYLGLSHGSGDGRGSNIMTQSSTGNHIDRSNLKVEQIEEMHAKLSKNLTRKADRIE